MSKNLHVIGGSVLGALALMAVSVLPASAAPRLPRTPAQAADASPSTDVDSSSDVARCPGKWVR